jgi:hypothetical protein
MMRDIGALVAVLELHQLGTLLNIPPPTTLAIGGINLGFGGLLLTQLIKTLVS